MPLAQLLFFFIFIIGAQSTAHGAVVSQNHFMENMLRPVECTRTGIHTFFQSTYNSPFYRDFLSACFMHVLDLIEYSHSACNTPLFLQQIFLIFSQKIKETSWINPYALIYFFERAQPLLIDIYMSEHYGIYNQTENYLTQALTEDFILLQKNPSDFIKKHSHRLVDDISRSGKEIQSIKLAFTLFFEQSVDRVIFDSTEGYEVWECFLKLLMCISEAHHASLLYDDATFQRILWSACTRFVYCIDLHFDDFNIVDYKKIIEELARNDIEILSTDEIDPLIISKREWLIIKLSESMIKKQSREPFKSTGKEIKI